MTVQWSEVNYASRHVRILEYRGSASQYRCLLHEQRGELVQATDWAQVKGTLGQDPWDYVPMCMECHHDYDDLYGAERRAAQSAYATSQWQTAVRCGKPNNEKKPCKRWKPCRYHPEEGSGGVA